MLSGLIRSDFNIVIPEGRPSRPIRDLLPDET